jgi:hypothetical protein
MMMWWYKSILDSGTSAVREIRVVAPISVSALQEQLQVETRERIMPNPFVPADEPAGSASGTGFQTTAITQPLQVEEIPISGVKRPAEDQTIFEQIEGGIEVVQNVARVAKSIADIAGTFA